MCWNEHWHWVLIFILLIVCLWILWVWRRHCSMVVVFLGWAWLSCIQLWGPDWRPDWPWTYPCFLRRPLFLVDKSIQVWLPSTWQLKLLLSGSDDFLISKCTKCREWLSGIYMAYCKSVLHVYIFGPGDVCFFGCMHRRSKTQGSMVWSRSGWRLLSQGMLSIKLLLNKYTCLIWICASMRSDIEIREQLSVYSLSTTFILWAALSAGFLKKMSH